VKATINGEERDLPEGATVADVLRQLGAPQSGIAVAVNDRVVAKRALADVSLADGDAVEIIRAVAGG
jgi:sulfur carrier protein